ncbi:hypothetical protein CPAR01_08942 [Colletotrichum paranaense]|uniref:Uncharacterized protein n=1 Tax=Colletotrichum paranaense TaxID=1914294 RepID=A0ABQ9SFB1_9PEZI|nr:uncharacterized protein CPAR01_08942 [Colletotrichum paranaense]XP_060406297.1 uncharacterized protein CABS01_00402 [Colletotrichum abscissum]KAK1525313.1 hypothetical protein CABS01_00402 [Colletotrichum abscissum]KAK1535400.1 hypothetical protein CPAR01_08942 [Colletotrichum paranaense]KAK1721941.1 hypothetical protein BDP67DRAFT_11988 [Colletotrichum lupini]
MTSQRALQCAENKSVASAKRDEATALSLASLRMGKTFFERSWEFCTHLHPWCCNRAQAGTCE